MTSLSPGDANALVQLRAMLEHARQSASTSSPVARLTALVLLDAVNERITHLAAQSLPDVQIGARDSFEDMYSKVKEALGSAWPRDNGWADVRKLHRARNAAQHEGLGADPALLPGFAIATERYTGSLVLAVFGVSIDQVYLADAITDPVIRGEVRAAEEALARNDLTSAMKAIGNAFVSAFDQWLGQHDLAHRNTFTSSISNGFDDLRQVGEALDEARDLIIAQSFATDPAEYTWFAHLRKAHPESVTSDEVRRALTFVFWWVVRWEAISASLIPDKVRHQRWLRHRRQDKVRLEDRPARLETVTIKPSRRDWYAATFSLADLPPEDRYEGWRTAVSHLLWSTDHAEFRIADFSEDDIILVEIAAGADPHALVQHLNDLLHAAETNVAVLTEQQTSEKSVLEQESATFAEEYAKRAEQTPEWMSELFLSNVKEVSHGVESSRLRLLLSDHAEEHWREVVQLIRAHPSVSSSYSVADRAIRIDPELSLADILAVLRDVDPDVSAYLEQERQRRDDETRASADLLNGLRAAIGQLP